MVSIFTKVQIFEQPSNLTTWYIPTMSVNDTLASLIYLFVFYRECSTFELKTIECVPSFYNEGAKGNDFVQKNKFP